MARRVLPAELRNASGVLDGPYCEIVEPSKELKQEYCARIALGASMHAAASECGIPYLAFGRALIADPEFANNLEVAKQLRTHALEEILLEQSTVGIDEQLTYQGHPTMIADPETGELQPATVRKLVTSNPSLLALLKANYPEKFRDKQEIWHHGQGDEEADGHGRITSDSDRDRLLRILSKRALERAQSEDNEDEDLL